MAKCFNRNTAEYKALEGKYGDQILVDNIIDRWQKSTKSDNFPTIFQAEKYIANERVKFSLKQKQYADAILANLDNAGLISKYNGEYYVNVTEKGQIERIDRRVAENNRLKLLNLLDFWNISRDSVNITRTENTYKVTMNPVIFAPQDIISQNNNKDKTHILDIVNHMQGIFPQLDIRVASVKEAREYYDSLKSYQRRGVGFDSLRSYYVNGVAYIIKGRVNADTAVEEVLHPFIDAVMLQKPALFNSLLAEAKKMFPQLKLEIDGTYTSRRGFTNQDRDIELVTQALSRHFNKEYEERPTLKWKQKLSELLRFILDVIQDMSLYLQGKRVPVKANMLRSDNTLSSLAKLLNNDALEFRFDRSSVSPDSRVKFSLTPERKAQVKELKNQATTDVQEQRIAELTGENIENKENFEDFTVGSTLTGTETPLVILNKEDHIYINVETGEQFSSVTGMIKGNLNDPESKYKINREIGDDFDSIMEYLAVMPIGEEADIESLTSKMKVLKADQVVRAVDQIQTMLTMYRDQGSVVIPQVVIADAGTSIAGTIDLLVVHNDGTLTIVDLKTSKNSIKDDQYGNRKYPVNKGSIFYDADASKNDQQKFTTKTQHNLQVNTYRRILQNMGYEVSTDSQTIHIKVDLSGKKVSNFRVEGTTYHNPSQMGHFVDQVVPMNEDVFAKEERADQADTNKLNEEDQQPDGAYTETDMYKIKDDTLKSYQVKLVSQKEVLERLQDRGQQTEDVEQIIKSMDKAINDIQTARMLGTSDVIYDELLQRSVDEIQDFINYINDPKEQATTRYIDRIFAMEGVAKAYRGIDIISNPKGAPLGNKSQQLRDQLRTLLDQVLGEGAYTNKGLINAGITNYTLELFRTNTTNANLTEEDIRNIITTHDTPIADISTTRFGVSDLATSPDPLSQLLDKIYKRQVQKTLDLAEERADEIRRRASKLAKLSPGGKVDYSFMLNYDKDGNFTGTYVKRIGQKYEAQWSTLRYNDKGESIFKEPYVYKDNLEDYTDEELAYNKKLYDERKAYADFMRGERVIDGAPQDGDYHRYTKEYKDAREKLMYFSLFANKENGRWKFKASASKRQRREFLDKYHNLAPGNYIDKDADGRPTGLVKRQDSGYDGGGIGFVKSAFVEVRDVARNGDRMVSDKYEKLMNPNPNDSLALAQKEFYLMYIRLFEEDLLRKLPQSIQAKMLGNSLTIRENFFNEVRREGGLVGKLTSTASQGIKNFFSTTLRVEKVVADENGNFIEDTLPIFYVGNTQDERKLKAINDELAALEQDFANKKIKVDAYKEKKTELVAERNSVQSAPSKKELSQDMAKNLLLFNGMAQNYETMSEIKNSVAAVIKTMENRRYTKEGFVGIVGSLRNAVGKGQTEEVGQGKDSNIVKRAKKWVNMVYLDNSRKTQGWMEKMARGLVSYTSLTYVGLNWFGNINNYAMGRLNNMVEVAGGRYYDRTAYARAVAEYNKSIPLMMTSLGDSSTWAPVVGGDGYKKYIPRSKYEGIANYMRMMDDKADIREQGKEGAQDIKDKAWGAAYMFQDMAEYNVQTKVGMAIMMSTTARNPETGEEMSYYDALQYNSKTGEVKLKEGFTELIRFNERRTDSDGNLIAQSLLDETARYDVRNQIREVNKQIHGNYAYADRMVIQDHVLGQLIAQFHKWVVPGLDARFRKEYYNENLGWVEGRYKSFLNVMGYIIKSKGQIGKALREMEFQVGKERADNKLKGMYRTLADFGVAMSSFIMAMILGNLFDDDDDDKGSTQKRLENALVYQFNRQAREFMFFFPVVGATEQYMMAKSPIPIMRSLGELAGAMKSTGQYGLANMGVYGLFEEDYDITKDTRVYYQRTGRKGTLKLKKEWADALPLIYMYNRWTAYDTINDWFVK